MLFIAMLVAAVAAGQPSETTEAAAPEAVAAPVEAKPVKVCTMEAVGGALRRVKVCHVQKPKAQVKKPKEDAAPL